MPFPQAVPNKPVIDREHCTYYQDGQVQRLREGLPDRGDPLRPGGRARRARRRRDRAGHRLRRHARRTSSPSTATASTRTSSTACSSSGWPRPPGPTAARSSGPPTARSPRRSSSSPAPARRDPAKGMPYCSKICCMYTAKHAMLYKHKVHSGKAVRLLHGHPRRRARGTRSSSAGPSRRTASSTSAAASRAIYEEDGKLVVKGADTLLGGEPVEIKADMVVLATAVHGQRRRRGAGPEAARQLRRRTGSSPRPIRSCGRWRPTPPASSWPAPARRPRTSPRRWPRPAAPRPRWSACSRQAELTREPIVAVVEPPAAAGLLDLRRLLPVPDGLPVPGHRARGDHAAATASSSRPWPRSTRASARAAAPAWPLCRTQVDRPAGLHQRAGLRRGCMSRLLRHAEVTTAMMPNFEPQDHRLRLQLVHLRRRRPDRHQPHQVRAQRPRHPAALHRAHRLHAAAEGLRPGRRRRHRLRLPPGRLPLHRGNYHARRRWMVFRDLLDFMGIDVRRVHVLLGVGRRGRQVGRAGERGRRARSARWGRTRSTSELRGHGRRMRRGRHGQRCRAKARRAAGRAGR